MKGKTESVSEAEFDPIADDIHWKEPPTLDISNSDVDNDVLNPAEI